MNNKKTPERLFLGLVLGLAGSLCALEYGKPILDRVTYGGDIGGVYLPLESPPIITLPKPKAVYVPPRQKPPSIIDLTIVPDVTDIELKDIELPDVEINLDFDSVFATEGVYQPEIKMQPLSIDRTDKHPHLDGFNEFMKRNLRFPHRLLSSAIEGKVGVEFVVNADGTIDEESIRILSSNHPEFSKEVKRVIRKMPTWTPGEKYDTPVPVVLQLPVYFHIK